MIRLAGRENQIEDRAVVLFGLPLSAFGYRQLIAIGGPGRLHVGRSEDPRSPSLSNAIGSIGEISGLPVRPSSRLKRKIVLDRKKPVKQMIGLAPL